MPELTTDCFGSFSNADQNSPEENTKMGDCWHRTKDWRQCKDEVRRRGLAHQPNTRLLKHVLIHILIDAGFQEMLECSP